AAREAAGAVDWRGRHLGRQQGGNLVGAGVVGYPSDGCLVQVGQHLVGQLGHAHFGVSHGRGAVAIHRTEVALTVYQQVAQRERLGHAHDGVVHSAVTVRVVFTDHVPDHTGGFLVRLVPVVAQLAHGEQY